VPVSGGHNRKSGEEFILRLSRLAALLRMKSNLVTEPEFNGAEAAHPYSNSRNADKALRAGRQRSSKLRPTRPKSKKILLMHELIRPERTISTVARPLRGGLPEWQQKRVMEFIEAHLAEEIPLAALAELADLSLFHFARAFTQSFGVPPHRYHMARRMDRARNLLQKPALSVTQIGIQIGFRETSSFTKAFRRFTGLTPTEYRRHRED
jgi:AraC-like DNA-binding protein